MKATVISNPHAGRHIGDGVPAALAVLERAGWSVELRETSGPGDASALARQAVEEGRDVVLVAGGDGTINEAVQAVAGSETALGSLPYGTVNVWARELELPLQAEQAARALVAGRIEPIDLGVAGDRYFLLMAGIGFDGAIVRKARAIERYKNRFGVLPYVASGLTTAPFYRGADFELRYDGIIRRVQAHMLVVGNTRLYGGRFRITPKAVANDGWLDLCIIKGRGPLSLARQSLPLLLSGSIKFSDVEMLRVRDIMIDADVSQPLQLDGELGGETPAQIRVAPKALRAIIPSTFEAGLIG
jgi:YegS/Rv2252/BmrU family lipid kinase